MKIYEKEAELGPLKQLLMRAGDLVKWLREETHNQEVMSSNLETR